MGVFMLSKDAIIERAEMYLRKLSCGINPLTDELLPETDSCKQERISKCLAYVASILQQQLNHNPIVADTTPIKNKALPKKQKIEIQDLRLDPEAISHYRFFDYPVSISRVVRNINELIPANTNMVHLLYADVASFLVQEGILSRQTTENGTEANLPTALGETYGFEKGESDLRGHHNIYTQCQQSAQQYILDNIQKCIAIANDRFASRKNGESDAGESPLMGTRKKFHITADDLNQYPCDDTPIPVSEIARRLNAIIAPDMERIYYKVIRDWFVEQNYLEFKKNGNDKPAYLPTEKGSSSGLFVESRTSRGGELFDVVMYDRNAQKLYLDYLTQEDAQSAS